MPKERTTSRKAPRRGRLWAVVLAGGEGKRLAPLTRALYGIDLPKQFAVLSGRLSLLQATIERIAPLVPFERIVVVACKSYEELARRQLAGYPDLDLVIQPRNLDTAPAILFPLARIRARDPDGRVAIFPSDHHFRRPERFVEAVHGAEALSCRELERVALIGAVPDGPETEYGWIVPGRKLPRTRPASAHSVSRFVEKPTGAIAQQLLDAGALWNTFASVGSVGAYWALAKRHLPSHAAKFEAYAATVGSGGADEMLQRLYDQMAPTNFSRTILERADSMAVVPMAGSGWSDWGSPKRVFQSLGRGGDFRALLTRLRVDPETVDQTGPASEWFHAPRNTRLSDFHLRAEPDNGTPLT